MEVPLENLASFLQMPLEVASVATKVPENMVMRSLELIVALGNYYLECWFELVLKIESNNMLRLYKYTCISNKKVFINIQ
jgi:hypothetical protein